MRLRSHEDFLRVLKNKLGEVPYTVISKYEHNKTPILIEDKYGIHSMLPNRLMSGCFPTSRSAVDKTLYTINRFKEIFGDRYDYSCFTFLGVTTKSNIRCRDHGVFQMRPNCHLSKKGCPKCGHELMSKAITSNSKDFIRKAISTHSDKYDYSKVVYKTAHIKVSIICKLHGEFKQKPNTHLNGGGCYRCSIMSKGYSRSGYVKQIGDRKSKLYLIRFYNKELSFFKIGITCMKINYRFGKEGYNNLKRDVIYLQESDPGSVWDLEKYLIKKYIKHKYEADRSFDGYTECFTLDLPVEEVINEIKNKLNYGTEDK